MFLKRLVKRVLYLIIIFLMLFQIVFPSLISFAADDVNISITPCPTIDIILAKSKTKVDVTNFESDLKSALTSQGISTDKVKVMAVEATQANIEKSFTWQQDISSSIGSISITNNGQNVVMKGNRENPGKNAIWIMPDKFQEQEFNFGYNVDFGDSFNAAGMLLRVKRFGSTLTGYMLSFKRRNRRRI